MAGAQTQVNVILDTYTGKMSKTKAQQELNNIEIGETTTKMSLMTAQFSASLGPIGSVASALGPSMLSGAMQGLTAAYLPKLIGKLVSAGGLKAALGGVGAILPKVGALIGAAGPVGLAIVAIGAAVGVFALAWKNNWFGIRDHAANAAKAIKGIAKGLADTLKGALAGMKKWSKNVVDSAKNAWSKAASWLKKATSAKKRAKAVETYTPPPGVDVEAQRGFEGLVRGPTTFLAGERGAEWVSVTPGGRPRGGLTINGPLLLIQGSANRETAETATELIMRKLRKLT